LSKTGKQPEKGRREIGIPFQSRERRLAITSHGYKPDTRQSWKEKSILTTKERKGENGETRSANNRESRDGFVRGNCEGTKGKGIIHKCMGRQPRRGISGGEGKGSVENTFGSW